MEKGERFLIEASPSPSSRGARGSVLFYILMAVALIGALSFVVMEDSDSTVSTQVAQNTASELYAQANLIRAAVTECVLEFPGGGGDLDGDNDIDAADNANTPYPLEPNDALNPGGAAGNDQVRNLKCLMSSSTARNMFQGAGNRGQLLPPPPSGYTEWTYFNTVADGVGMEITAPLSATHLDALTRFMRKFSSCQAALDYGSCGVTCLTVWIDRPSC